MPEKSNLDWKSYEGITKYIYEALGKKSGVKVECYGNACKVSGKSGVDHQIDVLTSHSDGIHSYRTAIECKYWQEKINKDIVMKVSEIISDANINKGVIVSKNGFTQDGIDYAKYRNIGLVELREIEEKDQEAIRGEFDVAYVEILHQISLRRPEIFSTTIEYLDEVHNEQEEINIYANTIKLSNGNQIPFTKYTEAFQNELHQQNKLFQPLTKRYDVPDGSLINKLTNSSRKIKGIVFIGALKKIDSNHNVKLTIVDQVWLIMKSIFDEKSFSISENGFIVENKK